MITQLKGLSQAMGDESYADDFTGCPACRDQPLYDAEGRLHSCICEVNPDTPDMITAAITEAAWSIDVEARNNNRQIEYSHIGLANAVVYLAWELEQLKAELKLLHRV